MKEPRVAKFSSFAEADKADNAYYLSLTPEQRLAILFQLRAIAYGCNDSDAPKMAFIG